MKLITYNIWHGKYLNKVIEFLVREKPDVVCLQEVDTGIFNEVKQVMGMGGEYRRMFWWERGKQRLELGVAILTRWPITETKEFYYEKMARETMVEPEIRDRYDLPRVILGVKIGETWIFTTHFTITPEATVTKRQLKSVKEVKGFLADYDDYVLCGDMNTPYGNETYKRLSEGLVDVSGKEPTLHPRIHKVGNKGYHVDYVFYKSSRIKQISTRIPLVDGSDHLPVVVELYI